MVYIFEKEIKQSANTLFTKTVFREDIFEEFNKHDISVLAVIDQENKLHFRIVCQTHRINVLFIKEIFKIDNIGKHILS